MVTRDEIKKIVMLSYLKPEMLDRLIPIVDIFEFAEKDVIFRQGEVSERFYMLSRGKIVLEQELSPNITVSVGAVKPGYSFGWSAMLDDRHYTSDAVCAEECEVFSLRNEPFIRLLDSDPRMGYLFTQRLCRVIKSRLDSRTTQLMRVIRNHPDIRSVL